MAKAILSVDGTWIRFMLDAEVASQIAMLLVTSDAVVVDELYKSELGGYLYVPKGPLKAPTVTFLTERDIALGAMEAAKADEPG